MPRPSDVSFGAHLKKWRTDRGLTQVSVAQLLGVSGQTIVQWESGKEPRDIEAVEDTLRGLQDAKSEGPLPTRLEVAKLWR